jgi:hypothetical protein
MSLHYGKHGPAGIVTCFSNEYLLSVFYVVGKVRTSEHVPQYKAVSVIDLDVDRAIVVVGINQTNSPFRYRRD